jgi:hypothetical protein
LNKTAGVAEYLGSDGLGQFITGSYAAGDPQAGMLAYVQTDDYETWSSRISSKMDVKKHRITKLGSWARCSIASELKHCFQTSHQRSKSPNDGQPIIVIFHTMFACN